MSYKPLIKLSHSNHLIHSTLSSHQHSCMPSRLSKLRLPVGNVLYLPFYSHLNLRVEGEPVWLTPHLRDPQPEGERESHLNLKVGQLVVCTDTSHSI